MNLEYFISSLPMLAYGQRVPLSEQDFRASCDTGLDGSLAASVRQLLDGMAPGETPASPWVAAWYAKEGQVRAAVARRRAARLGVPPPEVETMVADTRIEPAVNAAFEEINPLRREQALDRLRWLFADEMQGVQPISENVVLAYAVKLRLALRLQSLDETAGRAKFDELTH